MGILNTPGQTDAKTANTSKRKSGTLDFGSLAPLKGNKGTIGFAGYRDTGNTPRKGTSSKVKLEDDMDDDSDDDDDASVSSTKRKAANGTGDKDDDEIASKTASIDDLSAEEIQRRGELADGVSKMKLKRQHSVEPPSTSHRRSVDTNANTSNPNSGSATPPTASSSWNSTYMPADPAAASMTTPTQARHTHTPHASISSGPNIAGQSASTLIPSDISPSDIIGSPLKKQRPSIPDDSESQDRADVTPKASMSATAGAGSNAAIAAAATGVPQLGAFSNPALSGFGGGNVPAASSTDTAAGGETVAAASKRLADAVGASTSHKPEVKNEADMDEEL